MTKTPSLFRATTLLAAVIAAYAAPATGPAIGMAAASGSFQVDHARVSGNATLFDGSTIETAANPSQIQLDNGQDLRLSTETRARVYQNKLVLESGWGQFASKPGYIVEARSLHISADSADSVSRIRLASGRKVIVAAVRGPVRVTNAAGLLVATIPTGESLDFEPQPEDPAAVTKVSGCLLEKAGKFILAEQTTKIVLELQGSSMAKQIGNRVSITGTPLSTAVSVPDATQVVKVSGLRLAAKGGCSEIAKQLGAAAAVTAGAGAAAAASGGAAGAAAAGTAAGAATAAGVGATTVAVVGGVAAAATVGGLAAVGELPGQGDSPASASR